MVQAYQLKFSLPVLSYEIFEKDPYGKQTMDSYVYNILYDENDAFLYLKYLQQDQSYFIMYNKIQNAIQHYRYPHIRRDCTMLIFQNILALHHSSLVIQIAHRTGRCGGRQKGSGHSQHFTRIGVRLAREVAGLLAAGGKGVEPIDALSGAGDVLRAIASLRPDGEAENVPLPATPLLDTTLLTNSPGEPRIGYQLNSEVVSADRIDVLMAFVRRTGIRPMLELLRQHVDQGRSLRLLTTTYTNSTELAALEDLRKIGAQIRVSYDTSSTRLHAKAWLFHRHSGYSTAYIGSSNLTHSAQVTGLEWNVRVSGARNPDVIDKFSAVFESYWQHADFRDFEPDEFKELTQSRDEGPRVYLSPVEIRPEPFQSRLLELIELSRLQGHHRNLLVSATGTGKTVMAALDYQRLRNRLPRARLLFVAHRREIRSAMHCGMLRLGSFG